MTHSSTWAAHRIALTVFLAMVGVGATVDVAGARAGGVEDGFPEPVREVAGIGLDADRSSQEAGVSREVIRRTGDLRSRITATMPSPSPARQIAAATVSQDLRTGRIGGTVRLGQAATAETGADLAIGFGSQDENICRGETEITLDTVPGGSPGATYTGATVTYHETRESAIGADWNCAYAVVVPKGDFSETYDGLIGPLQPVYAPRAPKLRLQLKRSLSLKAGRWAKVKLTASNPGNAATPKVRVRLRAKGVKLKPRRLELARIGAGKKRSATFRVRLAGRPKGTVAVSASAGRLKAGARLRVKRKRVARGGSPVAGDYAGQRVSFRINRNRQLIGFRIFLPVTCGGYPDIPVTSWGYYSFRRVRVPASGRIKAVEKGELYTAHLEATVKGARVTKGKFSYFGPARCTGHATWTAKRKS